MLLFHIGYIYYPWKVLDCCYYLCPITSLIAHPIRLGGVTAVLILIIDPEDQKCFSGQPFPEANGFDEDMADREIYFAMLEII
jgi:hypothetical protein